MLTLKKFPAVLFYVILWRLVSVFVIQTSHVPDEYWQSLEVAHRLTFGYGYLTWEWREGIRSYIYPFFISLVYKMLEIFHLDNVFMLTTLPRLFQAILSGYADYRFYIFTKNKWALFNICINWYWYYCASRTLLNTLETSLTTIALSIFPWKDSSFKSIKYLWIVALLCAIRPTAAIIWTPLCLYNILTTNFSRIYLIIKYFFIGIITLAISTFVDRICYGKLVITPFEFLRINVLNEISNFYGTESIFWYFTQGIPVILGIHCLTFIIGSYQVLKHPVKFHRQTIMLFTIAWTVLVYSFITHKEFRFILPLISLFTYVSTSGTCLLNNRLSPSKRKIFMAIITLSNLLPGIYFCLIHQRGSLDAMKILQNEINDAGYYDVDILFLTPCHATPFYSHLHANVSARFITCEPNLNPSENYLDEADRFFTNPMTWLGDNYPDKLNNRIPSHLILFDKLAPDIREFLNQYSLISKLFYAHYTQGNYGQYLLIYKIEL